MRKQDAVKILALPLYLVFLTALALISAQPPAIKSAEAPPDQFSAERARPHLDVIAASEHPIGSTRNMEVRDYLLRHLRESGLRDLEVELQRTEVLYDYGRRPNVQRAATVENILARIPGARPGGPSLVLMSHYDSVPSAPGAADAGSGVIVLLEILRALEHREPLKNDLIVVITDGEEVGLMGAQAFFRQHRWAENVGLVINFEARGSSGPAIMFETSENNAALIRAFAKVAPYPTATSLSYEVYRRMPNDTDLSISKAAGIPGMNFGFVDDFFDYHTMGDRKENLDLRSVQQNGSNALALVAHLGQQDLPVTSDHDATYFNPFGFLLIIYSSNAIVILTALVSLLFVGVVVLGLRRRLFNIWELFRGFCAPTFQALLLFLLGPGVFTLMGGERVLAPRYWSLFYQHKTQLLGFVLLALAFSLYFYRAARRGLRVWESVLATAVLLVTLFLGHHLKPNDVLLILILAVLLALIFRRPSGTWGLSMGALAFWLALLLVLTFEVPGAAYLLTWPLLCTLLAYGWIFFKAAKDVESENLSKSLGWIYAGAGLGVFWLSYLCYFVYISVGVFVPGVAMVMVVLTCGLLVPALIAANESSRGFLSLAAAIAGTACLAVAVLSLPFDERHRMPNEIFYVWNADTDETFWGSTDAELDDWKRLFLGDAPEQTKFEEILPGASRKLWKTAAPKVALAAPEIALLSDEIVDDQRVLRFKLVSMRRAENMRILVDHLSDLVSVRVNGREVPGEDLSESPRDFWWRWTYYALPHEGIFVELTVAKKEPVRIHLLETAYRWPQGLSVEPRPGHMMRRPYSYSDSTLIVRSFSL